MKKRTRYIFSAALAGVAFGGLSPIVNHGHAGTITNADFTFETNYVPSGTTTGSATASTYSLLADIGTGTVYGVHADASGTTTVFSSPAGNGSKNAFSSNVWAVGDYYQFTVPTTGIQNIVLSFDQTSSGTGPGYFNLLYSTDGTNFLTYGSYSIPLSGTATQPFPGSTSSNAALNQVFNLASITALNNDPSAIFRIVDASTNEYLASTSSGFSSGTDRIDNVLVTGDAVPEPASLALVAVSMAGIFIRRRGR
jgi:hypothetical protein